MLQTSMMMKTLDLILGFQSPFTPPASTQLPQSGIGSKALLSGNLQSGKFTSICVVTYLVDKWLQQQEHNCQDADERHAYGGQLSTSNHLQHAAIVGGWMDGKRLANVSLLSFTASFLQQQKKVAGIPDSA
jgi:hypothetical protein